MPALALRTAPWEFSKIPLVRRGGAFRAAILGMAALGAVAVVGFWGGFLADYPATRDFYFTVAMGHVLVEFPFLLRTL